VKVAKKTLLILATCLIWKTVIHATDIEWNPNTMSYTIPSDGNIYYIDNSITLTMDLTIQGTFEIRSGGTINTDDNTIWIENTLTVKNGTLNVQNNGYLHNKNLFFSMDGGYVTIQNGGTIENPYEAIAKFTINNGTFTIQNGGNFNNGVTGPNGTLLLQGGTFYLQGGTITNGLGGFTGTITINSGTFILGPGTITNSSTGYITFFGANLNDAPNSISSGTMKIPSGQTMTIPSGGTIGITTNGSIENDGTVNNNGIIFNNGTIDNDNSFTNNGTTIILYLASFDGSYTNNGTWINFNTDQTITLPAPTEPSITIPIGITLTNPQEQKLVLNKPLINQSNSTINIQGTTYTYSTIQNGDDTYPGILNINFPGALILLGGTLDNHPTSTVTINTGGNLYNYYGTANPEDFFYLKTAGKFDNVQGNNPWPFSIETGGNFYDGIEINLDRDLDIDYTWTITNKAVINGYGNEITFGPDGTIVIDKDASLLLEDIIINNVSGTKIRCIDTNSTLSINNVVWNQNANFSFTWGKLYVENDWLIQGKNTEFSYESNQISTINNNATLHLLLTTLNYNTASPNLILLTDKTSILHIEDATLLATQSWSPTNGTLLVTGLGTLQGDSQLNLSILSEINVTGALRKIGNVIL